MSIIKKLSGTKMAECNEISGAAELTQSCGDTNN